MDAYGTKEMYNISNEIYNNFADKQSILSLQKEFQKVGYDVILLGNAQNIIKLLKNDSLNYDIVYNTVEGIIPALLETHNIPYIRIDSFGLSLTLNKYLMKVVVQHYGIRTPKSILIYYPNVYENIDVKLDELNFPIILKPNFERNSSGISVCANKESALEQINNLFASYRTDILCEEFIFSKEITVPYIDTTPNAIWDVTTVNVQKSDDF